jgi:hypothetical protein
VCSKPNQQPEKGQLPIDDTSVHSPRSSTRRVGSGASTPYLAFKRRYLDLKLLLQLANHTKDKLVDFSQKKKDKLIEGMTAAKYCNYAFKAFLDECDCWLALRVPCAHSSSFSYENRVMECQREAEQEQQTREAEQV